MAGQNSLISLIPHIHCPYKPLRRKDKYTHHMFDVVCKTAQKTVSFFMSVCQHGTTLFPLGGFP